MGISVEKFIFFIIILVRISAFIMTAPFFSQRNVPMRGKAGLSFFLALIVYYNVTYVPLEYITSVEFTVIILKEVIIGASIGYMATISLYILELAGHLIDMEIGFSMVNVLNPVSNVQTSVTGTFYTYCVMLVMLVSDMHYFIIDALVDTFTFIPVAGGKIPSNLYLVMAQFIKQYFITGFRIILPVFSCILIVNVVLGILAKIAPQMNMFVIGMQLKLFVGLFVLVIVISLLPSITEFIFDQMKNVISDMIKALSP
ncbi:flagellar biosynthetic protein FliR [Anaeromicropila populeti]|uniref:Flagellar biosynthetic protein FliR n=1 Tax=Anaeromicropila populeti TaxID=37658 RepID=A0A1I6KXJ3_9FIRM|nr:flagellar biosynthetic protein FliR [Anaeromicropila populeti]SFR95907.1 flagellar biosynthetic protein FliR [Anaeromicropila populeti]